MCCGLRRRPPAQRDGGNLGVWVAQAFLFQRWTRNVVTSHLRRPFVKWHDLVGRFPHEGIQLGRQADAPPRSAGPEAGRTGEAILRTCDELP